MANVVIDDTHLTNIAAAIREKNGLTDTYKPNEMAAAIQAITVNPGGGDTPPASSIDFDDYISRTLSGEVEFNCNKVGRYGLAGCSNVTKFNIHGLANSSYAFMGCSNLQELTLPDTTEFGTSSCSGNAKLVTVNAPQVTIINDNAFNGCKALTNITLGDITRVEEGAFQGCKALTKIDLGACEQAHSYYNLWIGPYMYANAFSGCEALTAIIIRGKIPCCQSYSCPFPAQFRADYEGLLEPGYIYVPRAMITEYQQYQANIAGTYPYYDHFTMMNYRAIEDYPEICG
jgi:hypothetical protein